MDNDVIIRICGVVKRFHNYPVLREIDLDIYRGESIVIIGQSGVGKSVLLKHIIGLLDPEAGQVYIDGKNIVALRESAKNQIRKRVGFLFQGAALFDSLTVGENVSFGLMQHHKEMDSEEVRQKVHDLLSLIDLEGIEDLKPAELSGGMRKRVGLARAIAMDPEIILYDEPTTGVDPIMGDVINDLILKLKNRLHATSISVTHDMASAFKIADRIAMMYDGKIIEINSPEKIQQSQNPFVQQFITGSSRGPITLGKKRGA